VSRVRPDRFDDKVEFVGAVDLARHAVGHIGPDELGFGEVIEPVNALRIAVLHEEHGVRRVFRPRDEDQVIGAEVEHFGGEGAEVQFTPARLGSAVVELAGGLLRPGYHHSAAPARSRSTIARPVDRGFCWACPNFAAQQQDSEFSTSRSAMAVAMVVLKSMLPQS
jgi:hypothetical protein